MKKITSILCILLLLVAIVCGCGQGEADPQAEELCFPGLNWNMTPEEAVKALGIPKGDLLEHETKATSETLGTYAIGAEEYKIFGTKARIVAEFVDFDGNGTYHLKKVTLGFSPDEDMEAIEAKLTKEYGEARPYYQTGADWNSEALCKDFLTDAQVERLSGNIQTKDIPDNPVSQISLRTDKNHYAFYGGARTNNAVFFASDYSYIHLEKGYPAA